MGIAKEVVQALAQGASVARGRVAGIDGDARLVVRHPADAAIEWHCDVLETGGAPPAYDLGDVVLVLLQRDGAADGLVLGRVARATQAPGAAAGTAPVPDAKAGTRERRLVLEADEEIVLRVGESSIRIGRDGKVVIRGQHVLTRAKGTNRIKGGSVAIN